MTESLPRVAKGNKVNIWISIPADEVSRAFVASKDWMDGKIIKAISE